MISGRWVLGMAHGHYLGVCSLPSNADHKDDSDWGGKVGHYLVGVDIEASLGLQDSRQFCVSVPGVRGGGCRLLGCMSLRIWAGKEVGA